jgi:hypothetical protein
MESPRRSPSEFPPTTDGDDASPAAADRLKPAPRGTTRRRFLATAVAGTGVVLVTGSAPAEAEAASFMDHTFAGLAAFVVPGNDAFSKRQGVTTNRPGGVDAQAGRMVATTLDSAIPLVIGEGELAAPGALGVALLLESLAINVNPLSVVGPFSSPFANLKFAQKRKVLEKLDNTPLLNSASIEFAANVVITLAAHGAYGEFADYNRRTRVLAREPRGWAWSQYGGVSDGWDEFIGYYQDRTEVTG